DDRDRARCRHRPPCPSGHRILDDHGGRGLPGAAWRQERAGELENRRHLHRREGQAPRFPGL
ncbi:MAG: hypothetical protein AVDCRST_MAG27-4254, partial [uncultured Craurococcus sp.]